MTIELKVLNDKIVEVSNDNTLLDMLMEFEKTLDELNVFAFKNWRKGEILEGPEVNRHRATVKLMYMGEDMPDPDAVKRLLARDMLVKYKKDTLIRPVKVKTYDDVEVDMKPDGGTRYKAKTTSSPVWVVEIDIPRKYIDKLYEKKPHHNEQEDITDPDTVDTQAQLDVADVKSNNFGAI
tara:strand:+ start:71 stop:610 length:540 start_codon:yes stop_codon:yes gene_type:complete